MESGEGYSVMSGKESGPCSSENWEQDSQCLYFSCSSMTVLAGTFAPNILNSPVRVLWFKGQIWPWLLKTPFLPW